ncbi:hypothetical protein THRCLA_11431 [Thraustotheca clavata]|uniref:CS domain-containing protein n=1 Tax=Thraustotheca clavata TaxID=74557 RepID=A0A1V9Y7Q8_9STRA|nr:hypothetical protein THRCLA_11431 [Thraustotheca clavata]
MASALENNIREKGQNAYYYAHKKRPDVELHEWDGQSEPRLLGTAEGPIALNTDKPITVYAWADGKKSVSVYIELASIGALEDEKISLEWTAKSVDVRIRGYDPSGTDLVFKIKTLYEEIMNASLKKKDDRVVLRLTKAKELTWYSLKKDQP